MPPSRVVIILPLFLNSFFRSAKGLSCRFERPLNDKPRQIPICCPSGWATLGACQGEVCAKAEGETCGGLWGMSGRCAVNLHCKTEEDNPVEDKKVLKDRVEDKKGLNKGPLIEVIERPVHLRGTCVQSESDKASQYGGNSEQINQEGMTKVKECESKHEREQCRCAEDHKDKCQPNSEKESGGLGKPSKFGWCFLENVIVYGDLNKKERGCYKDMRFSERHGRFYSYLACDPEQKPNVPERFLDEMTSKEGPPPAPSMEPDSLTSDYDDGKNPNSNSDGSGGLTEKDDGKKIPSKTSPIDEDYGSYELRSPKEGGRYR